MEVSVLFHSQLFRCTTREHGAIPPNRLPDRGGGHGQTFMLDNSGVLWKHQDGGSPTSPSSTWAERASGSWCGARRPQVTTRCGC